MFLKVGIYGISGAGKSTLANRLKNKYPSVINHRDGSSAIFEHIAINTFNEMRHEEKTKYREHAIQKLESFFKQNKSKHLFVTGHYSFWGKHKEIAWTNADSRFYDIIFFISQSPEKIQRNAMNGDKKRELMDIECTNEWQIFEQKELSIECVKNRIEYCLIGASLNQADIEKTILYKISEVSIKKIAEKVYGEGQRKIAMLDCDGTLNKDESFDLVRSAPFSNEKITAIFKSYGEYCFDAFYEISELVRKDIPECASFRKTMVNSSIIAQIENLKKQSFSYFIFISSGLPLAWRDAIANLKVQNQMTIGGASFAEYGMIVSNEIKGKLAYHLKSYGCITSAFGNGMNDFEMLLHSHQANVVYDSKPKKSLVNRLNANNKNHNLIRLE